MTISVTSVNIRILYLLQESNFSGFGAPERLFTFDVFEGFLLHNQNIFVVVMFCC
jgi:hypothetical protein